MMWLENSGIVIGTVLFMEGFAWVAHKYVMHGFGWGWHKSHHGPSAGHFEKNDLYAAVFSAVVIALFGASWWWKPLWWVALGITCYGGIYALVHDMLVHQRFGYRWVPRSGYLKRLQQAHRLHHTTKGRKGAVSFGFLLAPSPTRLKATLRERADA